ncbi:MAG: ribosome small subunit-dependent GTPase A [Thermoleophilia bacterium]|nr:ribosome small subunit-dependent GTPase A [Thermoleophilia bacterium]
MLRASLGWDASWEDAFEPYNRDGLVPARVAIRHHGPCVLLTDDGPLGGMPAGRLGDDDLPAVGDWVAARPLPGERRSLIEAVLPRRTAIVRKEAWRRAREQVLAANVDVAFLVAAVGRDLNPRRLERYLILAWESGAEPVIVLTKADLAADQTEALPAVESVAIGVPVHVTSSVTGEGVDAVTARLAGGRTGVLLGSSGVGKSTLANRLLGEEHFRTRELRADERGRHTTTHRELVVLPTGGVLLDTPGLREVQLWAGEQSLDRTFEDVAALAEACRFRDCGHVHEPGCAVLEAVETGSLSRERLASYGKLQRELRALEVRRSKRLQREQRLRWRARQRALRRDRPR